MLTVDRLAVPSRLRAAPARAGIGPVALLRGQPRTAGAHSAACQPPPRITLSRRWRRLCWPAPSYTPRRRRTPPATAGSIGASKAWCDAESSRSARVAALVAALPVSTYPDQLTNGNFGGSPANVTAMGLPSFNFAHEACHGMLNWCPCSPFSRQLLADFPCVSLR